MSRNLIACAARLALVARRVRAMEYPVGGAVHVSHLAGNGLLPYVMRFNLPACRKRAANLASRLAPSGSG